MAKAEWIGFQNIRLEKAHKKEIKKLEKEMTPEKLFWWLAELTEQGYQVSLSSDYEHDCTVAALTGKETDCPNAGYTMTQRHADPKVALLALWYAHVKIADGGKWEEAQEDWNSVEW